MRNCWRRRSDFPGNGPIPEPLNGRWKTLCAGSRRVESSNSPDPGRGKEALQKCAVIAPTENQSATVLLVDTSVWIEIFRKAPRVRLDDVAELEEIVTCLPVVQEVLQGIRDERSFRTAREAMLAMPVVESPLSQPIFEEAVSLYRTARRAGLTIRSGIDCLIAVCAMRNGLTVLHHDRDFSLLERVSPLTSLDPLQ